MTLGEDEKDMNLVVDAVCIENSQQMFITDDAQSSNTIFNSSLNGTLINSENQSLAAETYESFQTSENDEKCISSSNFLNTIVNVNNADAISSDEDVNLNGNDHSLVLVIICNGNGSLQEYETPLTTK